MRKQKEQSRDSRQRKHERPLNLSHLTPQEIIKTMLETPLTKKPNNKKPKGK